MATIKKSNNNNFLTFNKITGSVSLQDLQANGLSRTNTPQNLAIANGFVLTWDDKSNFETGVEIHRRSENESQFTKIGTVGEGVETYTDSNTVYGIRYYYKVRAYFDNGVGTVETGVFSNEVNKILELIWTARTASEQNQWRSVAFNGTNKFMAVTTSGTNTTMTSSDGATWSGVGGVSGGGICLAYGNGVWIGAPSGINVRWSDDDGVTWNNVLKPDGSGWNGIAYGNSTFVSVAGNGTNRSAWSDDDGASWNDVFCLANSWVDITFGNGAFVAVAGSGADRVIKSTDDGASWTSYTVGLNNWRGITFGNGTFVAVSAGGDIMYSSDGAIWNTSTPPITDVFNSVAYLDGYFVIVISGSTNTLISGDNGVTWNVVAGVEANDWKDITSGNNTLVAVSTDGTNRVMTGVFT